MSNLTQDLELLRNLNENRRRAKELRQQALYALKAIEKITSKEEEKVSAKKNSTPANVEIIPAGKIAANQENLKIEYDNKWIINRDKIESALISKIQTHRDISEDEEENNRYTPSNIINNLINLSFEELIQPPKNLSDTSTKPSVKSKVSTVPVLVAARVMQALVGRAETVFEPATLRSYYRIIRELYGVAQPNWTVGAARVGVGGTTSAFVTNECIRAIFSFKNALERTFKFFEHTLIFYENYTYLKNMLAKWGIKDETHPLYIWADKTVEVLWLDCYLSTNPRRGEIALWIGDKNTGINNLLLPDKNERVNIKSVDEYFSNLQESLKQAVDLLFQNVAEVYDDIQKNRRKETPDVFALVKKQQGGEYELVGDKTFDEEKISKFNRSATAHLFAQKVIGDAVVNASALKEIFEPDENGKVTCELGKLLKKLSIKFYEITRRVHRVLDPSKQYLKWVLNRELAASDATFDAGELVFAATSYGAINNWRLDDKLTRACEKLVHSLPDNGWLPTKRAFHADECGYRLLPIGYEMTRALANLLQKTGHDFDEKFVGRMLNVFEENLIELFESTPKTKLIAWNFEGSPNPAKPSIWVTAVSVLALDRIVRMLNTRINEIILKHFDVTKPDRPHTPLTLHDLIYSDYALVKWYFESDEKSIAINLQKMRAHVMRATLPQHYKGDKKNFSTIFYGPPGTGKTTFAEALALSARVPIVRLSPSDLILQGQELIEGRARDVFEALSMLSQCVVIFDEFEPVLKSRSDIAKEQTKRSRGSSKYTKSELSEIKDVLHVFSKRDDPKFRFVLGGMLPKFIKLHDDAEKQSFAYCLGTNYLSDIDDAAKRKGRFDKKFPVYKPDVLTRAGTLLYQLSRTDNFDKIGCESDAKNFCRVILRFIDTVAKTVGEPADQINKLFEVKKEASFGRKIPEILEYILSNITELPPEWADKEPTQKLKRLKEEIHRTAADVDEKEKAQRDWLIDYEEDFLKAFLTLKNNTSQQEDITADKMIEILAQCLTKKTN